MWGVDWSVKEEARGIKIMLKLVAESSKNVTTGERTPQFLKTLIAAYKCAPPKAAAEEDPGVHLPAFTPSPSPEREETAENLN